MAIGIDASKAESDFDKAYKRAPLEQEFRRLMAEKAEHTSRLSQIDSRLRWIQWRLGQLV